MRCNPVKLCLVSLFFQGFLHQKKNHCQLGKFKLKKKRKSGGGIVSTTGMASWEESHDDSKLGNERRGATTAVASHDAED